MAAAAAPPPVPTVLGKRKAIQEKWSGLKEAAMDTKLLFLACLPLADIVAVARTNKDFLAFVQTNFEKLAHLMYPLEDWKQAKCALAYSGGESCPTTEPDWVRKGTLLGQQNLRQDCETWCTDHRQFWDRVIQWIYDNIVLEAVIYKGQEYLADQKAVQQQEVSALLESPETRNQVHLRLKQKSARMMPFDPSEREHDPWLSLAVYQQMTRLSLQSPWEQLHPFPPHIQTMTLLYDQWYTVRGALAGVSMMTSRKTSWTVTGTCRNPLTLGQVAEAAFRIKRLPFDTSSERFGYIRGPEYPTPSSIRLRVYLDESRLKIPFL